MALDAIDGVEKMDLRNILNIVNIVNSRDLRGAKDASASRASMSSVKDAWERRYAREPSPWRGGPDATLTPWLAMLPSGRRLDLGAGGGRTHAAVGEAVAVDWVRASIAGLARPVVADLASLPFRDGAFAGVVAVHALGHVREVGRAAGEAARVLARGGRALVVEFASDDLRAGSGERVEDGRVREGLLTRYLGEGEVASWFPSLRLVEGATVVREERYGRRVRVFGVFEKP